MGGPSLEDLQKDVESYHRDLLFERYDVAAKSLAPGSRAGYLENIYTQGLRFAEIEVVTLDACQGIDDAKDVKGCAVVLTKVQWYAGQSPSVQTNHVAETWKYDEEKKSWFLSEQTQR